MNLETLINQLNFEEEVKIAIKLKYEKNIGIIDEIAKTAYEEYSSSFKLCNRKPFTRLIVVVYLLLQKYNEYRKLNIPDVIIIDTFQDVSLRTNLYFKKTGKYGITKEDVIWFRHIMNISIFKIGELQFQPFEMIYLDEETLGESYMTFPLNIKEKLPSGTPVINCHIQYGANIAKESVEKSLNDAVNFFRLYYPTVQYKALICYSWLLYQPMISLLKESSNIKHFANFFHIIGSCSDFEQAKENIFANKTNKMNSLQNEFLKNKNNFGYACGIIFI